MAKTYMSVELLDGETKILQVTTGDKVRAEREGLTPGTPDYWRHVTWCAAKRVGLPGTSGEGEEGMLAWLDTIADYDLVVTQEMVEEARKSGDEERATKMQALVREVSLGEVVATPAS